ncbi:AAA family ATPase [Magnetospirillum sp. UT-4]|uniref:AAA family ATPase n=1 Tax=Magnetospirillum sp. UT-4 TaxID=2681467 RepID=UPI00137DE3DE|nr:AAA family ATPase [Magnetospirillum sp. UT-4]CAA7615385.1 putative Flp pilus assembly protein ATPase CpaE [Magnetospirillum sp. UT-4]
MHALVHGRPATLLAQSRTPETRDAVARALSGIASLAVRGQLGEIDALSPEALTRAPPDVLLADIDLGSAAHLAALETLVEALHATTSVVVAAEPAGMEPVRRLIRLGIADLVPLPMVPAALIEAVQAALAATRRRGGGHADAERGMVIAFLKAGGGVGATTLAVEAAAALATGRGERAETCLMDLDLQFGAAALRLDIDHPTSLIELPDLSRRFDGTLLRGAVAHHASGIDLLPAPSSMHPVEAVSAETAQALVSVAAQEYRHVLIDLPPSWSVWTRAVLASADGIVLVLRPDVPSVRMARRQLDTLAAEGCGAVPLMVVANGTGSGPFATGVPLADIARALGRPVAHAIPRADRAFGAAADRGVPLSRVRGGRRAAAKVAAMIRDAVALARAGGQP